MSQVRLNKVDDMIEDLLLRIEIKRNETKLMCKKLNKLQLEKEYIESNKIGHSNGGNSLK